MYPQLILVLTVLTLQLREYLVPSTAAEFICEKFCFSAFGCIAQLMLKQLVRHS